MAKLSNSIEEFINTLLEDGDGTLEIQRALIADRFNCAPSQINYVLTTRFTPYKGYYVESRRGGGGYIRIVRVQVENPKSTLQVFIEEIGDSITKDKADQLIDELLKREYINRREYEIIKVGISDRSLGMSGDFKNEVRASILKNMVLVVFS
ncbi:transcriptional regulator CtsR [Peptoniphilus asaccharolyticus DSM 20463]|uniref:Transcriptional regulator CtsR n=1 Tax=Peptoniphilus asaccharolyticus DSM 20463 TaxID=573058 RepID=A0A1W1ULL0_PEPAS|nr:CtsR family transcriptional regulator [Peptoniphilus asaccharolyticus]MBL7574867.1 CtsR family transcriptional regulator [Peptoniphilus asaccharolyticus]SMB81879.1 transcriptional regulator CtsR [Peptoniphilus asaccharolyticus DSM 20463]